MTIISLAHEIDIEQEVIIATLNSALHQRGDAKELASKAGISTVYLSYIRKGKRMFSTETAHTVAHTLPISRGEQEVWLHHVDRYWQLKHQMSSQSKQIAQDASEQGIADIRQASVEATFVHDSKTAGRQYSIAANAASALLDYLKPDADPLAYLEMSLILHDSYSVLNQRIEALYTAKRAKLVAENLERSRFSKDAESLNFLTVNAIRSEAVSFHNLSLDRQAYELCQSVQSHDALKHNISFWKPHIFRDQLNALAGLPRFSVSEAEGLAKQVVEICTQRGGEQDELLVFLIHRSLAHAYIQHNNFRKARKILEAKYKELNLTSSFGALHRVAFLRTFAELCWKESDLEQWRQIITEAVSIAIQANLFHQLHEMEKEYSDKLVPIVSSVKDLLSTPSIS